MVIYFGLFFWIRIATQNPPNLPPLPLTPTHYLPRNRNHPSNPSIHHLMRHIPLTCNINLLHAAHAHAQQPRSRWYRRSRTAARHLSRIPCSLGRTRNNNLFPFSDPKRTAYKYLYTSFLLCPPATPQHPPAIKQTLTQCPILSESRAPDIYIPCCLLLPSSAAPLSFSRLGSLSLFLSFSLLHRVPSTLHTNPACPSIPLIMHPTFV
ncbi:hypothetical protein B0H10DRAFT_1100412 [Mycena sp. CBHHK59/15]|nr:hypothetical protein B0H10DRAFT_1100412 [Mycena sp. CBHHK59/15]